MGYYYIVWLHALKIELTVTLVTFKNFYVLELNFKFISKCDVYLQTSLQNLRDVTCKHAASISFKRE